MLCRTSLVAERNLGSLRKERDDVLCTQIEQLSSLYQYKTRPLTADWLQMFFSDSVRHCSQEHFSKIAQCTFKELQPPLLRLMYIAKTLINPLFTDVAFLRDREGVGSGHHESGGGGGYRANKIQVERFSVAVLQCGVHGLQRRI